MKENFKNNIRKANRFMGHWSDAWLFVPVSIIFFFVASFLIGAFFPESGFFPAAVLHKLNYAACGTFAALFTGYIWLKFHFPQVNKYLHNYFQYDLLNEDPELKSKEIKNQLRCARLKYSLLLLVLPVAVFLVVLLSA